MQDFWQNDLNMLQFLLAALDGWMGYVLANPAIETDNDKIDAEDAHCSFTASDTTTKPDDAGNTAPLLSTQYMRPHSHLNQLSGASISVLPQSHLPALMLFSLISFPLR